MRKSVVLSALVGLVLAAGLPVRPAAQAKQPARQSAQAPQSQQGQQGQQYGRLVIRDAMFISGRGMPAEGPVDLVIEKDRLVDVIPTDPVSMANYGANWQRPTGDRVIDAKGLHVMPGIVDMHTHTPRPGRGMPPELAYKLWLGHGVTTIREAGSDAGIEMLVEHRRQAEEGTLAAPRFVLHKRWPNVSRQRDKGHTPDEARALVRAYKEMGADGIKVSKGPGHFPDIIAAIADEAKKIGMRQGVMVDLKVSETDAVIASNAGVQSVEHWYGVPDAAIPGTQRFPPEYNYWNEEDRFRWAGHLWKEASKYPERLEGVLQTMLKNGTNWNPTMVVYEANRDIARARRLEWHDRWTPPALMKYWSPNPNNHGSYHANWKTADEIAWRENFQLWMASVKRFWELGGVLTVGADAGAAYALYGVSTIRELELLQEAGLHPIDIIQIATRNPWKVMGRPDMEGLRAGHVADLIVIDGNPLDNFKVLYGMGIETFDHDGKPVKHGGVKWTVKAGRVYDAPALLRDVEAYAAKERGGTNGKTS